MRKNMRRFVMAAMGVALIATLALSATAFAKGPDGASREQNRNQATQQANTGGDQVRDRDQDRTCDQAQTQDQDRKQERKQDRTQDCATCDGDQTRAGTQATSGHSYGPGDGTGPIGCGQFGPGVRCVDLNRNGICDCKE